jgi:hypothetical protein
MNRSSLDRSRATRIASPATTHQGGEVKSTTLDRTELSTQPTEGSAIASTAREKGERAAKSRWVEWLGRFGLLAQGASFVLVGVLAIELAAGLGGKATSREGAIKTLADETGGTVILLALALGFAGYAIWRFAQALFDREDEGGDPKGLAKRAGQAGKGAIYVGLAAATVSILVGGGSQSGSGDSKEKEATAGVLGWPAGRWLVAAAGLVIAAVAVVQVYRAVSRKFMDDIDMSETGPTERRWIERFGVVGLLARAVVFGLIAWFLMKAAVQYDPHEAVGLGGALARLANGQWLLGATAAGVIAFGLFCAAQARYRQV